MIAVPKHPRPHQTKPVNIPLPPVELPLKQQLINQIAVGAVKSANELRELIKLETAHLKSSQEGLEAASGASHAIWNRNGEILESLPLTATAGAKAWFAEREQAVTASSKMRSGPVSGPTDR